MKKHYNTHYDVQRLNEIPISSVVDRLDVLKRKGVRHLTTCPWHEDKNPSLTLYEGTGENHCYCFACGHRGSVIDYVMQHEGYNFKDACKWLAGTFGVGETQEARRMPAVYRKPKPEIIEPEPTFIPMNFVDDMASDASSMCKCMRMLFEPELVNFIAEEYRLGVYEFWGFDDCVTFPSIDQWGNVHNIKVQHYCTDATSEKFAHSDGKGSIWLGVCLVNAGLLPKGSCFSSRCLFGEHLLAKYPRATVALVESPKNALFGAATRPELVWVATGNKEAFKLENIQALKGRDVIVFPDHDAYDDWNEKAERFRFVANFSTSKTTQNSSSLGEKYDIADLILEWRMQMPL